MIIKTLNFDDLVKNQEIVEMKKCLFKPKRLIISKIKYLIFLDYLFIKSKFVRMLNFTLYLTPQNNFAKITTKFRYPFYSKRLHFH